MIIKLSIIVLVAAFIVFLALWAVRAEEKPNRKSGFLDPNKSYRKAHELGLDLKDDYNKMLPGI